MFFPKQIVESRGKPLIRTRKDSSRKRSSKIGIEQDTQHYVMKETHPMVTPMAQTIGIKENARAKFVESVISAIIHLMTPMFPLSIPARDRLAKG